MKRPQISCILFLVFHLFIAPCYAKLTMEVNKQQASQNETITLTLRASDPQLQGQPNLQLLQKDFNILSTEHQMSYNLINGVPQSSNEWIITLFPKHVGTLTIPPLSIGQEAATQSLALQVTKAQTEQQGDQTSATFDTPKTVFIQTSLSTKAPFLNAQTLYTVKVFSSKQLINVNYTPPKTEDALVIPLQPKQYRAQIDGQIYAVDELKYALFPNKTGNVKITPPSLQAVIYDYIPEQVDTRGKTIRLSVQPAPADSQAPFLPAENIQISETLTPQDQSLTEGSTLTRTLTITARGVPAAYLPQLDFNAPNVSAYPSPPSLENETTDKGIIGKSVTRITYLFNQAGTNTLPAIELPWFNVKTKQFETARLPEKTFTILADKNAAKTNAKEIKLQPQAMAPTEPLTHNPWIYSTFILLFMLILLGAMRLFPRKPNAHTPPTHTQRQLKRKLKAACTENNPQTAAKLLLEWASQQWPSLHFLHLKQITQACDDQALAKEIEQLTQCLYQTMTPTRWEGTPLWSAFQTHLKKAPTKKQTTPTPPTSLNPK